MDNALLGAEIMKLTNPFNEPFTFSWDKSNGGPTITMEPLESKLLPKGLAEYGAMKMAHKLIANKKGYSATLNKTLMEETRAKLVSKYSLKDVEQPATVEQAIEELNEQEPEEVKEAEVAEEEGFDGVNDYNEEDERKAIMKENNPRAFRAEELDETMSKKQLMDYAIELELEVSPRAKKDDIIELIVNAEAAKNLI